MYNKLMLNKKKEEITKKKIIEKDIIEFKKLKQKAEYFPIFDKDKTKELEIIAKASKIE